MAFQSSMPEQILLQTSWAQAEFLLAGSAEERSVRSAAGEECFPAVAVDHSAVRSLPPLVLSWVGAISCWSPRAATFSLVLPWNRARSIRSGFSTRRGRADFRLSSIASTGCGPSPDHLGDWASYRIGASMRNCKGKSKRSVQHLAPPRSIPPFGRRGGQHCRRCLLLLGKELGASSRDIANRLVARDPGKRCRGGGEAT